MAWARWIAPLVALLVTTVAAPSATAASYENSDEITPLYTVPTVSDGHDYTFDVDQGDTVSARVTWDDPRADLDLYVRFSSEQCDLLAPPCAVGLVEAVGEAVTCQRETPGTNAGFGPGAESVTKATGQADGFAVVSVLVGTGVPSVPVAYDVAIDVNGGEDADVAGPHHVGYWRLEGHCRV